MNPRLHVRSARWISTFEDAGIIVVHVVVSAVHPVGQNVWWTTVQRRCACARIVLVCERLKCKLGEPENMRRRDTYLIYT